MKVVNIKKFIRSMLIILFIIIAISIFFSKPALSHKELEYKTLYVEEGDTLWSISEELQANNSYYENKDIRDIIIDIKKSNDIQAGNLYVNQKLIIACQ